MEGKQIRRRMSELELEVSDLEYRMEVIKARLTKEIWTDERYAKEKEKLKQAELILRLDADLEARDIRERMRMLVKELDELSAEELALWHEMEGMETDTRL
ncbi:MAG: hypothetical protein KAX23_01805 [Dehalococcoidia bacterium]|jgi:cell division protein FtsB|nr:hypothetical protein [Chloroflexota bacterium]MCK4242265.1 hypothetical protein [Dehalococcoidia bacterium]